MPNSERPFVCIWMSMCAGELDYISLNTDIRVLERSRVQVNAHSQVLERSCTCVNAHLHGLNVQVCGWALICECLNVHALAWTPICRCLNVQAGSWTLIYGGLNVHVGWWTTTCRFLNVHRLYWTLKCTWLDLNTQITIFQPHLCNTIVAHNEPVSIMLIAYQSPYGIHSPHYKSTKWNHKATQLLTVLVAINKKWDDLPLLSWIPMLSDWSPMNRNV